MKNAVKRSAGVLMHVSSLPGKYGIGTLGESAYRFIDILSERKIKYWQVLPLVQTSFGDSPYQSEYSGSGNPYFIDPDILCQNGLLTAEEVAEFVLPCDFVDYGKLYVQRDLLLRKAFSRFDTQNKSFVKFVKSKKYEDYALYAAIKHNQGNSSWDYWKEEYKFADKAAISAFKATNKEEYLYRLFLQYEFFNEWQALRKYAHKKGIKIIGDIPLYVAYDSADVWANPALFKLSKTTLKPKKVAGVPPDYFSASGQLWGNPVYNWAQNKKTGYAWWIDRFRRAFELYDVVRVDHFRGFDRYYEINYGESTAVNGKWVNGPKIGLFKAIKKALGDVDIIAEDLGTLDEGVYKLLASCGFPGMKVIEFAFDGNPSNPYLPENICENSVCYTGTHDNDTLVGFVESLDDGARQRLYGVLKTESEKNGVQFEEVNDAETAAKAMIMLALGSKSKLAVVPVQDIYLTDSKTRMNIPSSASGNWQYRIEKFDYDKFDKFAAMCKKSNRTR